MVVWG